MKDLFSKFWGAEDIPPGVRILTIATSVRWIGWGFAESLIPVFLYMFAGSFAMAGVFNSAYDVAFIIALPLVGLAADRSRATTLVLIGLSLYVFVGLGYFLAGFLGLAVFVVLARAINGVGYAFDEVGRETYVRRHTPAANLATVFGYFDSIANFWWAMAAIVGIFLVSFIPIYWLLFLIAPTTVLAMGVVYFFGRKWDVSPKSIDAKKVQEKKPGYRELVRELGLWNWQLKTLVGFNFFIALAGSVVMFFLPIQLYKEGSGYVPIILMGVIITIPAFFGWVLGKLFDKKGTRVFLYGLIAFAVLVAALGFTHAYVAQIAIAFLVGIILELLSVGSNELITVYADPAHFGRVDGLTHSITDIGSLIGPIAAGVLIDMSGPKITYGVLALIILALAFGFVFVAHISSRRKISPIS